jgi:hypothetical protein
VNKDKCHCTLNEDITFMGTSYSQERHSRIPLAPELQNKLDYLLEKLELYKRH